MENTDDLLLTLRQRYVENKWRRLQDENAREEYLAIEEHLEERCAWARKHPEYCIEGPPEGNGIRTLRFRRVKARYGTYAGQYEWTEQTEVSVDGIFTMISDKKSGAVDTKAELQEIITHFC